ncbi:efflux RND transporter permease subunit [Patescibacteria group bacterium]|nr:efflux RND transporter permease subunit [Patescibacteria group bacterium]
MFTVRSAVSLVTFLFVSILFLGVYFGISAQYLSWILPLAILVKEKMIIPFSISGIFALFGFYTFFGPEILFGKSWYGTAFQSKYVLLYFLGNLALWITILWWFIKIINNYTKEVFNNFSLLRKRITIISLVLFMISLFPILRLSLIILNTILTSYG